MSHGWFRRRIRRGFCTFFSALAAGRAGAGVRVLAYHSIDETGSPLSVAPDAFAEQLAYLLDNEWKGLSAAEYLSRLRGRDGATSRREVLVTFDDAYANFQTHAAPLLEEFGIPATVFVATDFVGQQPSWLTRDRAAIESPLSDSPIARSKRELLARFSRDIFNQPLMTWEQLRALRKQRIDVESHSAAHHFLTQLSDEALTDDLQRSRRALREHLGPEAGTFLCYPYGDCDARVGDAARSAGFKLGFLSQYQGRTRDPMQAGRTPIGGEAPRSIFRFALSAAADYQATCRRWVQTVRHSDFALT